jgi:formate hydrogenlyase subunit 6/NADH:ubiquinone oxidoreductase subunit I
VEDLPRGWTDRQAPAHYSLEQRNDEALFGFVIGPVSWKKFLFPPHVRLFSAQKTAKGFEIVDGGQESPAPRLAFLGIRSCELHALAIHDKIFARGRFADPTYTSIRSQLFIVAVQCTEPGGNCFCVSQNTGPRAESGFDLALTEVLDAGSHYFAIEAGTAAGEEVLGALPHHPASDGEEHAARAASARAVDAVTKSLQSDNLRQIFAATFDHPAWDDVAKRCLACANCTMVCPTCFCSTVEDSTDLAGTRAERVRRWDSCYTMDFARVAGGNNRPSTRARYRQWITHKFSYWNDQFGVSGCVGCGRCITWCPVGIDITAEVERIRAAALPASAGGRL